MYEPVDALQSPRYSGPRACSGCSPAPRARPTAWTSRCSAFRGTRARPSCWVPRFGPEAVRSASALLRPYNPAQDVNGLRRPLVRRSRRRPDGARVHRGHPHLASRPTPRRIHRGGAIPLGIGGDHSVTLAEACAPPRPWYGPLGSRPSRRAPRRLGLGFRSGRTTTARSSSAPARRVYSTPHAASRPACESLHGPEDYQVSRDLGMTILPWLELREAGPGCLRRARAAEGGHAGPLFFTFDVDFLDPAYCPGTGTPEVGGPTSAEVLDYVRSLHGLDFRALDVVEVVPQQPRLPVRSQPCSRPTWPTRCCR